MLNKKFAVITNKNNYLSAKCGIKNYVIGFQNHQDAYTIQKSLPKNPNITATRKHYVDIAHEVKLALMTLNIPIIDTADEITIDPDAKIEFPRILEYDVLSGYDSGCESDDDEFHDETHYDGSHKDITNDPNRKKQKEQDTFGITFIEPSDFLMFPFEKNVGIIMPYELVHKDDDRYIYSANLVDSSSSTKMFVKSFNKDFLK